MLHLPPAMDIPQSATYQIDTECRIQRANEALCRLLRCAEAGLIGRDVHDLVRADWRDHYRPSLDRARDGVTEVAVPIVAPCGLEGWFTHTLEPVRRNGTVVGYRATVVAHVAERPLARAS